MIQLLLAFSVFFFYSCYSNAQLLEEGETVTTEIESQGEVEEVTETTVTVEHKTTGDVLDGDTGVVANRYEGDADVDWGGAGSVYSHSSCTDAASGLPPTGTDGRTSACGHARDNSLTTWRQYVDLNSFGIEDGGEVNYEFLFAFPNSMYQNSGQTAYVQTKGYNDNVLQWETGLVTIDKTTFTQNPYNYNNNTNWVNTVTGSYDFANQLDKVYIEIGGYGEYYWDEFQYNVVYNQITTVIETWMQVANQQQVLDTTLDLMDTYTVVDTYDQEEITDNITTTTFQPDTNTTDEMEDVGFSDDMITTTITDTTDSGSITNTDLSNTGDVGEMFEELQIDTPTMNMDEVAEVAEVIAEIQEIETDLPDEPPQEMEASPNEGTNNLENTQESSQNTAEETEAENTVDSTDAQNENEVETSNTPSEKPEVESEEKEVANNETEEKEVANNETEEKEVAEETKEEPKEEVAEESKEEEVKETQAEEKPTKEQENKQEKAKKIIANFDSQYDAVAQIATLALVNALGPNISTYSNQVVQTQPQWYKTEEIYSDAIMPDPLGNYFGVRDSLVFEQMIGSQYE